MKVGFESSNSTASTSSTTSSNSIASSNSTPTWEERRRERYLLIVNQILIRGGDVQCIIGMTNQAVDQPGLSLLRYCSIALRDYSNQEHYVLSSPHHLWYCEPSHIGIRICYSEVPRLTMHCSLSLDTYVILHFLQEANSRDFLSFFEFCWCI